MKRSRIRPVSKKKAQEKRIEAELRAKLLEEHGGKCQECGNLPDFRGLSLHHRTFKSHGGISEPCNVLLICGHCHSKFHGIIER